jgi:hypothetical protein
VLLTYISKRGIKICICVWYCGTKYFLKVFLTWKYIKIIFLDCFYINTSKLSKNIKNIINLIFLKQKYPKTKATTYSPF